MVIEILDHSLDMSFGEIPGNLSALYRYLIKRLTEVHATLDIKTLDECNEIIGRIRDGFVEAYAQLTKAPSPQPSKEAPASIQAQV